MVMSGMQKKDRVTWSIFTFIIDLHFRSTKMSKFGLAYSKMAYFIRCENVINA